MSDPHQAVTFAVWTLALAMAHIFFQRRHAPDKDKTRPRTRTQTAKLEEEESRARDAQVQHGAGQLDVPALPTREPEPAEHARATKHSGVLELPERFHLLRVAAQERAQGSVG